MKVLNLSSTVEGMLIATAVMTASMVLCAHVHCVYVHMVCFSFSKVTGNNNGGPWNQHLEFITCLMLNSFWCLHTQKSFTFTKVSWPLLSVTSIFLCSRPSQRACTACKSFLQPNRQKKYFILHHSQSLNLTEVSRIHYFNIAFMKF